MGVIESVMDSEGAGQIASGKANEVRLPAVLEKETGKLRRIIAGMGYGKADADDILQEVRIKALKGAGKWETREQAVAWLIRVTANVCVSEYRRRKRFRKKAGEIVEQRRALQKIKGPVTQAIDTEELEIVRRAMSEMDAELMVPLSLRYFSGLNSQEIAQVLDMEASTVRSRIRKARMVLAKKLINRGIER